MDPAPERIDAIVDEVLDQALQGRAVDLDGILARFPDLTDEERRRIRSRTSLLTTGAAGAGVPFERLGEFRILRRLGEGGMGVVFLAEQASLGRQVAVKVIRPEYAGSAEAAARFEREARAVAQLRHPNIVAIHAAGIDNGVRYLVMDLVPGLGLDERLRGSAPEAGPVTIARAVGWALDIADALTCAHAAGVLHRDVKPSNIRITGDDRAMLVDFGLARLTSAGKLRATATFVGSPAYASPEQVEGDEALDERSDVYSLAVTLYECLSGALPFRGTSTAEVLNRVLHDVPPRPTYHGGKLPRDLETILLKALEKNPKDRYLTAAAFAADLRAFLEYRPIAARPAGWTLRARKWCTRNRGAAVGAGSAAAMSIAFVGWLTWDRIDEARTFQLALDTAASAAGRGDHDAAIQAYDRALAIRPHDTDTTQARVKAQSARDAAAARAARQAASERLAALRTILRESPGDAAALDTLRRERNTRYLTPEEHARIGEADSAARTSARAFEHVFFAALEFVNTAERFEPGSPETADLRAELWLERWRDSRRRGDGESAAFFERLVESNDVSRRHVAKLHPLGALQLETAPPGAEVHLFRYREQADVVPGGEHRLVPVPVNGAPSPVPPGTWCLRVIAPVPGIESTDVIVKLAGRPIRDVLLVPRAAGEIHSLDRLVSIDGNPMREAFDASKANSRQAEPGESHDFEFERDGKTFVVKTPSMRTLGIRAWEPDSIAWEVPSSVEVWRDGKTLTVDVPGKLGVRTTGAPLFLSPQTRVGTSPVSVSSLEPGSYLAIVKLASHETQRIPFIVDAREPVRLRARLLPEGSTPPGYVHVPEGPFRAGGDPASFAGWPASVRQVPEFWIHEREVSEQEYVAFLNDRRRTTPLSIEAQLDKEAEVPGIGIVRGDDGKFATRHAPLTPMTALTWSDAKAYAAWWSVKLREAGFDFVADLPTEEEWEKAARGVDGRAFVFGDHFNPTWVKSRFAHDEIGKEISLRFPLDESPYGAFDMTGSQWEWCLDTWQPGARERTVRGGTWSFIYEANFRAASRAELDPDSETNPTGLRLVLRKPVKTENK